MAEKDRSYFIDLAQKFLAPTTVYDKAAEARFRSYLRLAETATLDGETSQRSRYIQYSNFWLEQEFRAVLSYLPEYLRGPTRFAYFCGWRLGEVLALRWPHLIDETTLQIPADETKDGNRRTLVLWGELLDVIEEARARRLTSRDVLSDLIFHDDGRAIGEFKKPWRLACCAADAGHFECRVCNQTLPFTIGMSYDASRRCAACDTADAIYHGRLFHDLRRTAARNMRKAGVPESTIMATTGHKTDAMFRRYDIKDEGDLLEAQQELQRYLQEQKPKVIAMRKGR